MTRHQAMILASSVSKLISVHTKERVANRRERVGAATHMLADALFDGFGNEEEKADEATDAAHAAYQRS